MKDLSARVGFSEFEYCDLPSSGSRAYRDRRKSYLPPCSHSCNPNWKVRFVFDKVTFTTNVEADDEQTARKRAVANVRYTYYPEHNLKALGPLRSVHVARINEQYT